MAGHFLGAKPALDLDGNNLVLTSGTTEVTLLDREQAEPDQPLTGITWGLSTIIDGDTASSVPDGASAHVAVQRRRHVQFEYGCNPAAASTRSTATRSTSTRSSRPNMACGANGGPVEAAVAADLNADNITYLDRPLDFDPDRGPARPPIRRRARRRELERTIHDGQPIHRYRQRPLVTWARVGLIALAIVAAPMLTGAPRSALAADPTPGEHVISVSGTGKITVKPDVADVSLGVQAQRETAKAARDDAARQ